MKAFWNYTSSFIVPVGVLFAAMAATRISFEPAAAYTLVFAFMVLKVVIQHFKFEPGRAYFSGAGRETLFRVYAGVVYSLLALATVQLFVLATS